MKVDRKTLYLVQPVEVGEDRTIFLHSAPISTGTWELYYRVLSAVYSAIMSEGLNVVSGPSIAIPMLREMSMKRGIWEGDDGVKAGFLNEVWRLTNAFVPTDRGWEMLPLEVVKTRGIIDAETLEEAEGAIVFFTCVSAVLRGPRARDQRDLLVGGLVRLWGVKVSFLPPTEFLSSLPTLTPAETSSHTHKTSSVPH